jgi:hypothetical protein
LGGKGDDSIGGITTRYRRAEENETRCDTHFQRRESGSSTVETTA